MYAHPRPTLGRGDAPGPAPSDRRDRRLLVLAWSVTLTLSSLPAIVVGATGTPHAALTVWGLAAAAPLVALVRSWRPARALRPYVLVMLLVFGVAYVLPPVLGGWLGSDGSGLQGAFLSRTVFLLLAAAMAAVLVKGLGLAPGKAFLTPGNLSAASGVRLPGTARTVSWAVLGSVAAVALFALLGTVTWFDLGLGAASLERLVPMLPLVVGCAALNALGEEVVYRSGPLATLVGVVGPRQAVLLTSVWFGLAHYFGSVPEGPAGVAQSGVLALLLGGAMVATRGLGWPWLIHLAVDLVVFASIALTGT